MESANKNVRDLQGLLMEETGQNVKSLKGATAVHRVYSVEKKGRQKDIVCYRCKGQHAPEECKFLNELCHKCGKRGHIKQACKTKQTAVGGQKTTFKGQRGEKGRRTYLVREEESNETEDTLDINTIYSVSQVQPKVAPIAQKVKVNGMEVDFEVDTGCGVTIISKERYSKLWKQTDMPKWRPCRLKLKTYTGEKMEMLGQATVTAEIQNVRKEMMMVVVDGEGPNLLGRGWLKDLGMLPQLVNQVKTVPTRKLADVLDRHADVFKEELGQLKGTTAKTHVNPEAQPRFYKPGLEIATILVAYAPEM